jgi:8-oxo-dGTP pyrophosphatase MutT (NUDIX family)
VVRRRAHRYEVALAEQNDLHSERRTVRLPKGHLEQGESPEQAALREVLEESGLRARIIAALDVVEYVFFHREKRARVPKRVHFFLMAHLEGEAHAADGEMERVFWCDIASAESRLTFASERVVVRSARSLLASDIPPRL